MKSVLQDEFLATLFPSAESREHLENHLTRVLLASRVRVREGSATPTLDIEAFRGQLASFDFAEGQPVEELLSWTIAQVERGIVHVTHPRYFGLFNPHPTFMAECADRISAVFNPQLATSTTSPAAVEIEAHVIRAVGRRVGFSLPTAGHFTSGGTEANFTALLCALTRSQPAFSSLGARAFRGQPVFYVSRESHLAWFKIAHQAGLGRSALRLVATDGHGRLDPSALADGIRQDKAKGCVPVMVAATAGTTNAGMIDPLPDCARVARDFGLWYHVDAAWGGALIASERHRRDLLGLDLADSVTIDAHKWFATTMGCGMFITPHALVPSSVFNVAADFMPSAIQGIDPYVTSVQWSRRFVGLRMFLSLGAVGWPGYARHVENAMNLAAHLRRQLQERGWSVINDSPLAVVCALPPPGSAPPRTIAANLLRTGRAWASATQFEGRDVIRACVTNGTTSLDDICELVEALEASL